MSASTCLQCGKPLAPADSICPACGKAVPQEARQAILGAKADALFDEERYAEAARAFSFLDQIPAKGENGKRWHRRRALSLQRGSQGREEESLMALQASLLLDDQDGLSHQLWMDSLARLGRSAQAKAWYQARLEQDPNDEVAIKQMQVLKLSLELATQAPPKLDLDANRRVGFFEKLIKPTPTKRWFALASGLGSVASMVIMPLVMGGETEALKGDSQLGSIVALGTDPWINGLTAAVFFVYWWFTRGHDRG